MNRIEKEEDLAVELVIVNGSDRELRNPALIPPRDEEFRFAGKQNLPPSLPPFGSVVSSFTIKAQPDAAYGPHNVVVGVRYGWSAEGRSFVSMQTATLSIDVKRPFEDEASGLPGGTAALFNLLLPLLPAFFAYQIVDRLRKGDGLQVPVFGSEYILPAFFIGLLATSLRAYNVPLGWVLGGAAVLGALWPAAHWAREAWERRTWGFHENDDETVYLRKALLARGAPRRFIRISGRALGETWSGVELAQPDGALVLGATLQVTPRNLDDFSSAEALVNEINNGASRKKRRQLLELVNDGSLTLSRLANVDRGGRNHPEIVVTDLVRFARQSSSPTKFLEVTA